VTKALAVAALALVAVGRGGHDFTVSEAQHAFRSHTGLALVRFTDASTPEVTSLRTRPHNTRRFGEFQLFVLKPSRVEHLRRVFTHGTRPDGHGVHWVSDQAGGWIAVTLYRRNVTLAWFPPSPSHSTDERWTRLEHAVAAFAPALRR
jgi:hypothetical protein